ncbi:MAG: hypothetical protein IPN67_17320 [Bacteroidales bacterium]|nr:hypothetical protein [Bacteroidales bacterium]MBK8884063.1 hypothetical protein [Bacteroidales bacterium]
MTASGGIPYGIQAGAGEAGMGYACVVKEGFWSSFHNQALLPFNNTAQFAVNYENRFGIKELGTSTAGAIIPVGKASVGAVYSHFGYTDFKRDIAGLACGVKLSEKIAAGVQIDYFTERTSGEYNTHRFVSFEAGLIAMPADNIRVGCHLFNPLPNSLRKNNQPVSLSVGAGIDLSNILFAGAEAEMSSGSNLTLRTGFEYEAVKNLRLRAGFSTRNNSFCFGTGYEIGFVTMDLGFTTHDRLGVTSSVSFIFKIK